MSLSQQLSGALSELIVRRGETVVPGGKRRTEGLDTMFEDALAEAKDAGPLSKVKKKPAPHMWFIAKTGKNSWVVSIGDPTKTASKLKRTFHSKDDLRYWVKHEKDVSNDHIIDRSGLKLVPDYYSQWYVDNIMKESVDLAEARGKTMKDTKGKSIDRSGEYVLRHKKSGKYIAADSHPADSSPRLTKDAWNGGQLFDGETLRELPRSGKDWTVEYEAVRMKI